MGTVNPENFGRNIVKSHIKKLNLKLIIMKYLPLVLFLGLFFSCDKDSNNAANIDPAILGSWINPNYDDSIIVLERSKKLKDADYGIEFKEDGSLIERKNSGWCGTPPIHYSDFKGTWSVENSLIRISVDYWGGKAEYEWEIESIDSNKLTVIVRLTNNYPTGDESLQ